MLEHRKDETTTRRLVRMLACSIAGMAALFLASCGSDTGSDAAPDEDESALAAVFPYCAWPVESTPELANEAGPDPNATYWTMPFKTDASVTSLTIAGTFPTARFASFVVYNNGGDAFSEMVDGQTVESALADYQLVADPGALNPWQVDSVPAGTPVTFTVTLARNVTLAQQQTLNMIPIVDTGTVEQSPVAPADIGFVTFRTYIPAGGNGEVQLPTVTINQEVSEANADGELVTTTTRTTLPTCNAVRIARAVQLGSALESILDNLNGTATPTVVTPCTIDGEPRYTNGCPPPLEWSQASAEQIGALFPNPSNAYISMYFYPQPGTVVVTRGLLPSSPRDVGDGELGDSIGATPVNWTDTPLPYQMRYWSVNNYLVKEPYPVVTNGVGSNRTYGGVADYQTTTDADGYYTIVSSLPADKPSGRSLSANSATWIPMQGDQPDVAETQWMRNMLGDYPYAIQEIPPAESPTDYIPGSVVESAMGPYYPVSAQCPKEIFETGGVSGCFAASSPASGPAAAE